MKDRRITEALDRIEPQLGAKERIYGRIMEKKAGSRPVSRSPRRVLPALAPALCLALALFAGIFFLSPAKPAVTPGDGFQMSGFSIVDGPEDFAGLGVSVEAPGGAEDVLYFISGEAACVRFTLGGHEYHLAAAKLEGDLPGVADEPVSASPGFCKASWSEDGIFFFFGNSDGAPCETVLEILETVR